MGILYCVAHNLGVEASPQAGIYDIRAVVNSPSYTSRYRIVGPAAIRGKHLHGHDTRSPRHSCNTGTVVAYRCRYACGIGAVPLIVVRAAIVIYEVEPGDDFL